ncbi:MAG: peptidase C25, partial [Thermoplasmatales archaeon]
MKKISYFVAGLLLISGFAAISIGEEAGKQQKTINLTFSEIEVIDSVDPYIEINFEGAGGRLYRSNQPVLPIYATKMDLPFGTQITDIECQIGEIKTLTLENKIVPAPTPVMPGIEDNTNAEYIMDENIYNSNELFPNNWFDYYVGVGRDENKDHKTFLNVRAYPVRYSPGLDIVNYVEDLELTITYLVPEDDPFPSNSQYDLVIIAPQEFASELNKLVTHKNNKGVQTLLKTTEDIYSEYSGIDKPEEIKYFIKDALETYDMDYVLLVGGLDSYIYGNPRDDKNQGTKDWHVPVRYT